MVPIYWFGADVGAHVSHDHHIFWYFLPWEILLIELKTMHGLIAADMQVGRLWINLPGARICDVGGISVLGIVNDFD